MDTTTNHSTDPGRKKTNKQKSYTQNKSTENESGTNSLIECLSELGAPIDKVESTSQTFASFVLKSRT